MDRSHTNLCFCTSYEKSPEETLVAVLAYRVLLFACRHFNSFSFYRVLPGEARWPSLLSQEVEKLGWTKRERKWQAQGFDLSNQPRGPSSPFARGVFLPLLLRNRPRPLYRPLRSCSRYRDVSDCCLRNRSSSHRNIYGALTSCQVSSLMRSTLHAFCHLRPQDLKKEISS